MISFITGKPGDGKSLFGTRMILERLVETERFIVTNIPLVREEVLRYVSDEREKRQRKERLDDWHAEPFDIDKRLLVIDDDQVKEFWRYRSGGLVLDPSPDAAREEKDRLLPLDEFRAVMKANFANILGSEGYQLPVDYFIDEAHDHFDSRAWASSGRGTMFYASKHRHLHDNVWLLTQVMDNVEKRLRTLTSETHVLRNQLRRRVGPIKMRPVFRLYSFYGTDTTSLSKAYNPGGTTFRLDPARVAACYKTCGALGVKVKPEEIRNKGLPWWFLPVGGVAIVLMIAGAFIGLPYIGAAATKSAVGNVGAQVVASAGVPLAVPANADVNKTVIDSARETVPNKDKATREPELMVKGVSHRGNHIRVVLTDGSVYTDLDPELTACNSRFVVIDGKRIRFVPLQEGPRLVTPNIDQAKQEKESVDRTPVEEGSWLRGLDGVLRLKEQPVLGR